MTLSTQQSISSGAEFLLRAAEKLFALNGIEGVSTRQIAREAGQKNHSAVQYHFGSIDGLLEEILNFRMLPLGRKRSDLLDIWQHEGGKSGVRGLVKCMVDPLADELLQPIEESYYISLLMQLATKGRFDLIVDERSGRSESLWRFHRLLQQQLSHLDEPVANARQIMMGRQLVTSVADWDRERRQSGHILTEEVLSFQKNCLIDFIEGGLNAK